MARQVNLFLKQFAELQVDEAIGDAAMQMTRGEPAMAQNSLMLWLIFGAVVLLILIALAVTYGRLRRQQDEFADGEDIFDQRFSPRGFESEDVFGDAGAFSAAPLAAPEDSVEAGRQVPRDVPEREEMDAPQNVVPLRAPEVQEQPDVEPRPMERMEEPRRREAAMGARAPEPEYDYGATGQGRSDWTAGLDERAVGSSSVDDDEAPFIAPFIREYIETSERRQGDRLDDLRDDMRRQLSSIREEQSSRLDLFLNAIERRVGTASSAARGDIEEGASTRRRIDSLSDAIDRLSQSVERQGERLTALNRSVEERFAEMSPVRGDLRTVHEDVLSFRHDVEANTLAISRLREDFDTMKEDFGRMERSFLDRAQSDQGMIMRLADVVRGTLEEGEYKLGARLSNGHEADALIMLAGGRSAVAVDSRFPIESFNNLPSRDAVRRNLKHAKAAEDEFRRTVLRAIFACADRCIVEGETTDSAILFLPSEAAYTILHDRFPDLVRDSHRARVWLTSPSTLMGTLALLHNVFDRETYTEEYAERRAYEGDEAPFYVGPEESRFADDFDDQGDDAAHLEERLRSLREEEQALADELARKLSAPARPRPQRARYDDPKPQRRYKSVARHPQAEDDFETRLERFSFDLDDERDHGLDDAPGSAGFRRDRDEDLR